MANNSVIITPSFVFVIMLIMSMLISSSSHIPHHHQHPKETKMTVYFHDVRGGANASIAAIAGIPGSRWSFANFGTVFAIEDLVRVGISNDSAVLGHCGGIYVISFMNAAYAFWSASFGFTSGEYSGSTLELQGRFSQTSPITEVSIVSGTGKFRFARGYAILELLGTDNQSASNIISRCDLSFRLS